jgi:WD40 repeat protein
MVCLAFGPDGKLLAAAGGRMVRLIDLPTRRVRAFAEGSPGVVECLALSPDGKLLATGSRNRLGGPTSVRLWDVPALLKAGK